MTIRHGMRVGAAAFALGLALAGPAGLAAADGGESDGSAVSSDRGDARGGAAKAGRSAGQSRPGRAVARDVAGPVRAGTAAPGSAASEAGDSPGVEALVEVVEIPVTDPEALAGEPVVVEPVELPTPDKTDPLVDEKLDVDPTPPPVGEPDVFVDPGIPLTWWLGDKPPGGPIPTLPRDSVDVVFADDSVGLPGEQEGVPVSLVATGQPAAAAVTDVQESIAGLRSAVVRFSDSVSRLLSSLPPNPFSELVSGALLLVRRTLFNQAPTASFPVQLATNSMGQVSGSLGVTDPEGDRLTYTLTKLPQFGAVEIGPDGGYVYSPNPDFPGADSFTVEVRDSGLNLLDPFGNRAVAIDVQVPDEDPGPLVGASTDFIIRNLSGQSVMLMKLEKERGYENDVKADPPGAVVPIGGDYRINLTDYAFYEYVTKWQFAACVELNCEGGKVSSNDTWVVRINRGVIGFGGNYWAGCLDGRCENDSGRSVDGWGDRGFLDALGNRTVVLVDDPGTKRTVGGDQAQRQAAVISSVCSASGAFCSFISNGPVTSSTVGKTKIFNNNSPGEQNISNTYSEQISAASSTKITFSQETEGNIGVKGAWGLAFKAAFGQELSSTKELQTTTTVTINQVLPAFTRGTATFGVDADRVTGTYTAKIKNTEFVLTDVWFDFPRKGSDVQSYNWTTEAIARA